MRIVNDPKFTHEVVVLMPVDDGHTEETFRATFRVIGFEEANELAATDPMSFFDRVLVSCDDITDEKDKPLAWTNELRTQVLAMRNVQLGLISTYFAAVNKVRAGN